MQDDYFDPNVFDPNFYPGGDFPQKQKGYTWSEAWTEAVLHPSERTYQQIISDPRASLGRAMMWVSGAMIFNLMVSVIYFLIAGPPNMDNYAQLSDQNQITINSGSVMIAVICCSPFIIGIALIILGVLASIMHVPALLMGGSGSFEKLIYALSAFYAPLLVIGVFFSFIPIPVLTSLLSLVLLVYQVILAAIAIKVVHRFGWAEAIVSALAPMFLLFVLFCGLVGFGVFLVGA